MKNLFCQIFGHRWVEVWMEYKWYPKEEYMGEWWVFACTRCGETREEVWAPRGVTKNMIEKVSLTSYWGIIKSLTICLILGHKWDTLTLRHIINGVLVHEWKVPGCTRCGELKEAKE